jgi:hypothetical protein
MGTAGAIATPLTPAVAADALRLSPATKVDPRHIAIHLCSTVQAAEHTERLRQTFLLLLPVSLSTRALRMKFHKRSKYRVIYADPPWPEYGGGKIKRGADRHYPLMPIAAILQLGDALQPYIDEEGCHEVVPVV